MKATEAEKKRMRAYYLSNRERLIQKTKEYRIKNLASVKLAHKNYAVNNRGRMSELGCKYYRKRYLEVVEYFGNKCKCGFGDIRALQIHHRSPKTKLHRRDFLRKGFDLSLVELVCCNCHAIEHADFRKSLNRKWSY